MTHDFGHVLTILESIHASELRRPIDKHSNGSESVQLTPGDMESSVNTSPEN